MKPTTILPLAAILGLLTGSTHAALIGHWKFDDGAGSAAVDSSGSGYDADQVNADGSWTTGKVGGAYNQPRFTLDATESDNVNQAIFEGSVTISLWVTNHNTSNWAGMAGFEGTSTTGDIVGFKMSNADKIIWTTGGGSLLLETTVSLTDYAAATSDGWVHLVGTFDGTTGTSTMFVNGSQVLTGTTGPIPDKTTPGLFRIGTYYNSNSYEFNGAIDDVQVYDQALTAADITFLLNNPGSPLGGGPATIAMGAPSANTVTDDGATTECQVFSADADAVTLVWAEEDQGETDISTWTSATGGGSHSFGAASQDEVLSHAITGLDGDTAYFFRFYATAGADSDWSGAGSFATGVGGSLAPADLAGTAEATTVGTKVDLTWTDGYTNETGFVIQRSTDAGFGSFDEFSVGADETGFSDGTTDPNTTYYYRIAAVGSSGTGPFSSNLEVTTGDAPELGLIAHWTFDDASGTTAADSSGSGYDADQTVAAGEWISGKAGGAYDVPRFSLDATESDALNLGGGGTVTLSVWVTVHGIAQFGGIAGFEGTGATGDIYSLKMDNADRIVWTVSDSSSITSPDTLANYAAASPDGWVHLVGVFEQGTASTLYVNGSPVVTGGAANPIPDKTPPGTFNIGRYYNSGGYTFGGAVDDVQVYSLAASADDVAFLFSNPGSVLGEATGFELFITPNGAGYDFTWASLDSKVYDLVSSTDLTIPVESWPLWEGNGNLPGTAPSNILSGVAAGPEPTRFFAVIEKDLLAENFEGAAIPDGWSATINSGSGTEWGVGDPSGYTGTGDGVAPSAGAGSSTFCAGTNMTGDYGDLADCSLTTPALAIPAGGATLGFRQWIDTEAASGGADYGAIKVRDAGTSAELGILNPANIEGLGGAWEPQSYSLDAYAGQTIKIEFLFTSNDSSGVNYAGWYLDDVTVTGK
jgi:hypothetical protein